MPNDGGAVVEPGEIMAQRDNVAERLAQKVRMRARKYGRGMPAGESRNPWRHKKIAWRWDTSVMSPEISCLTKAKHSATAVT